MRLAMDETSEEGQRYVAELIERQNIDFMHEFAMEHMPEAFVPVHMLYIRMKINNCPVIAFIDSGTKKSFAFNFECRSVSYKKKLRIKFADF